MLDEADARELAGLERGLQTTDPAFLRRFAATASALTSDDLPSPSPPAAASPGPVVVAVDDSLGGFEALHWAATHAGRTGSALRIVHALRTRALPDAYGLNTGVDLDAVATASAVTSAAVRLAEALAPSSTVTAELRNGPAGPAVAAATTGAGLLVLGASTATLLRALLGGSTVVDVLRRTRCPVAVVPSRQRAAPYDPVHVVVGIDAGPRADGALTGAARSALRTAAALAVELGCPEGVTVHASRLGPAGDVQVARALRRDDASVPSRVLMTTDALGAALRQGSAGAAAVVTPRFHPRSMRRAGEGRRLLSDLPCPVVLTSEDRWS